MGFYEVTAGMQNSIHALDSFTLLYFLLFLLPLPADTGLLLKTKASDSHEAASEEFSEVIPS